MKEAKKERGGRVNRINSLINQIVASEFIRSSDPILNELTITYVDTSIDMKKTTVYISSLNNKSKVINHSLMKNRSKVQKKIAEELMMKYTPKLIFEIDPFSIQADKINELLNNISDE